MHIKNILLGVLLLTLTSSFTQLYSKNYEMMDLSNNLPELGGLNTAHFEENEVSTLVNEEKPAGEYEVEFNSNRLTSGVYFCPLRVYPAGGRAGNFIETKKILLIK